MATLDELIVLCRSASRDESTPPLVSDAEWAAWLNDAEAEACIRARLIEDEEIIGTITAGDPYVQLPANAFSVSRAVIAGGNRLHLVERHELDLFRSLSWEGETGSPELAYRSGSRLRLVPTPVSDGDLVITAFCTPSKIMVDDSDSPQIPARLHNNLVEWALRSAYRKPDADLFDLSASARHEAEFERVFGPRPNEVEVRRTRAASRRRGSAQFV